jgi:hypothetical protein
VCTGSLCHTRWPFPAGNCDRSARSDPHQEFGGKNVLYQAQDLAAAAAAAGKSEGEVRDLLGHCRQKLHAARAKRPRPSLDNKVRALAPAVDPHGHSHMHLLALL